MESDGRLESSLIVDDCFVIVCDSEDIGVCLRNGGLVVFALSSKSIGFEEKKRIKYYIMNLNIMSDLLREQIKNQYVNQLNRTRNDFE